MELKKPGFATASSSPESDYSFAIGSDHSPPLHTRPWWGRVWVSFQRDPGGATITHPGINSTDGRGFDASDAAQRTADSPLARKLKGRHLQMIAIGGSIGMSFHRSL